MVVALLRKKLKIIVDYWIGRASPYFAS